MGIYNERKFGTGFQLAVLGATLLMMYGVWLLAGPELTRAEGLFAAAAAEWRFGRTVAVIHGWATPECFPLFPAAAAALHRLIGIPMESALRGVSIFMLLAGTVTVYFAASSRRSVASGMAAAAMYSTSLLSLGNAVEGTPATGSAFWLLTAQLVFFQYGVRKSDWNRAWIYSALLLVPGFFWGGIVVPVFFAFPLVFLRRPLSVSSKFRKPGFVLAALILAATLVSWSLGYASAERQISPYDILWRRLDGSGYGRELAVFPFEFIFWTLPWTLVAWMPFCVALQDIDSTPIFSRYLRTLFFPTLALLWLTPAVDRRAFFFLLGPLSVMTGVFYEPGVRRYGVKLRKCFFMVELFSLIVAFMIALGAFCREDLLRKFVKSMDLTLGFRHGYFNFAAIVLILAALLLALYVQRRRGSDPAWMILLTVPLAASLFFNGLMYPYRSQARSKRAFGRDIRAALAGQPGANMIYTFGVSDLNGGLFYTGMPVRSLDDDEKIPVSAREIYLICAEFPPSSEYSWSNLLPQYKYNKNPLALWKGVPRPPSERSEKGKR